MSELADALIRVNAEYLGLSELPPVRYSKGRIQARYKRLTLGTYDPKKNEIRIHPLFREGLLPGFVRDYVLYHELLHYEDRSALMRPRRFGRRRIHTPDFHRREREFPRAKEAMAVIKQKMKDGFV